MSNKVFNDGIERSQKNVPDPRLHQYVSFAKSAIRIVAGVTLSLGFFVSTGILIILAEILGIVEEIV